VRQTYAKTHMHTTQLGCLSFGYEWWFRKEPFVAVCCYCRCQLYGFDLTAKSIQSTALTLQGVDDVHGGDGLPLGVLGVGYGIPDDVLEKYLQHTASLFVDQTRNTLHATSACQTTDGRLGDSLDVVAENLPVTLGASFSQSLTTFTSTRHDQFQQ